MYTSYNDIDNFYNRVRKLINITEDVISDEEFDYDYAPTAEEMAKSRVPKWEELTDAETMIFNRVVIVQTAIYALPFAELNAYKVKQTSSLKVEYRQSPNNYLEQLQTMLNEIVASITPSTDMNVNFIGFDITQ